MALRTGQQRNKTRERKNTRPEGEEEGIEYLLRIFNHRRAFVGACFFLQQK